MMSSKYFEYYTILRGGGVFSWTRCAHGIISTAERLLCALSSDLCIAWLEHFTIYHLQHVGLHPILKTSSSTKINYYLIVTF